MLSLRRILFLITIVFDAHRIIKYKTDAKIMAAPDGILKLYEITRPDIEDSRLKNME